MSEMTSREYSDQALVMACAAGIAHYAATSHEVAALEGRAYGHLFRAQELLYDREQQALAEANKLRAENDRLRRQIRAVEQHAASDMPTLAFDRQAYIDKG